jgi:hypothetical protein
MKEADGKKWIAAKQSEDSPVEHRERGNDCGQYDYDNQNCAAKALPLAAS